MKTWYWKLLIAGIFLLSACDKIENSLSKKDGTWLVATRRVDVYDGGVLAVSQTDTNALLYVFNNDGTGTYTDTSGTEPITWTVDEDESTVFLCEDHASGIFCFNANVEELDKNTQRWTFIIDYNFPSDYIDYEMVLMRQD